jgi:hypothetical protein
MSDTGINASEGFPLPPASFEFFVISLKTQAEMHLGLLHFGEEKDRPAPNVTDSRFVIDLLAVLQEKTKGNLTVEEQRLIDNTLTELRFRYVQALETSNKADDTEKPDAQAQTQS